MYVFGYNIIIITKKKIVAIFSVFVFHLFLRYRYQVIIGWEFELNAAPAVVLMIVHDHNIWLAFHVTLFPARDSFPSRVLQFTQASHNDGFWIKPSDIFNYFAVQIGFIFNLENFVIYF